MRVLLVEDNAKVASFIAKGLKEEHYAVDMAEDGAKGYRLLHENDYDLAVVDVLLPKMDGFELVSRLRNDGIHVPILMLTAKTEVESRIKGLDSGADDYLTKPFSFEEFLARLRALSRRGEMVTDPVMTIADLRLDPTTHEVWRGDQKIDLTVKEFALLHYLLRNKGRVVSRTTIIEHVWDIHFDTDTNVVDVYIRYLRRKMDEEFTPKLIHTVRGVGYILREDD